MFVEATINKSIFTKKGALLFRTPKKIYQSALIKVYVSKLVGNMRNKGGKNELSRSDT
jgi:hypothetical protein